MPKTLFLCMTCNYNIRHTTDADIAAVMRMFNYSRGLMRADGNTVQWTGYPTADDLNMDIRSGVSYIIEQDSTLVGTFAMVPGIEPTYGVIDHGRWIDEQTPYVTVHRMAKCAGVHGIADFAFRIAKERYNHLRVDTHATNRAMRHLLDKEGFVYCGIIYMPDGSPRVAYEWWRYDEVPADLKAWVEDTVLPQHEHYDSAHRPDHIRRVIARAMMMAKNVKSETDSQDSERLSTFHFPLCTYTAAAMHDIGICEGREVHHLASGRIIRACQELHQWFTDDEIEQIAQAAEDHRASATSKPRSMLGCILAEADRDVEPETIVRRTVEYGLSHYPELDREGHWQRTLQHLDEKYSEHGYIKLWLDDSPNAAPLAELRDLIRDHSRLRPLFDELFDTLTH